MTTSRSLPIFRALAVTAALGLAALASGTLPAAAVIAPAASIALSSAELASATPSSAAGGATDSPLQQAQKVAAALQNDPVYLESGAEDAIGAAPLKSVEAKLKKLPYPSFLVARTSDDFSQDNSDFLTLVGAALNKPGLYMVLTPGNILYFQPIDMEKLPNGDNLANGIYGQGQVLDAVPGINDQPAVAQLSKFVDLLLDPQPVPTSSVQPIPDPSDGDVENSGPSVGLVILGVAAGVAIVGALVAMAVVVGRRRGAERKYALPDKLLEAARNAQRSQFRKELSDSSLDVANRLEELKVQDLSPEQSDQVEHGLDAYGLASGIVDDAGSKTVDLAGALVLLRLAERDLFAIRQAGTSRRTPRGPLKLCVVNPLHGEAKSTSSFKTPDGRTYKLPTCSQCSAALGRSSTPDWLYDGDKPYFEGKTVWAQSLYGAFGGDLVAEVQKAGGPTKR